MTFLLRIWHILKSFWMDHSQHAWVEHHLLYFSVILGGAAIAIISFIIGYKLKKQIQKMDEDSRKRMRDMLRQTSDHSKDKEKPKLKFDED
jgi:hypothetical protein